MKKIVGLHSAPGRHWVGDGFPVRSLFSYNTLGQELSPFLLLDHAAPFPFNPGSNRRGVGEHPHRGFETVTVVYEGEVEHRDSTGAGGKIGPGDVQWMTAGAGIMHEEFHSEAFTNRGGTLHMVQLWVNLPAKDKMAQPSYQTLLSKDIPVVSLPDAAGSVRVIAGEFGQSRGAAKTFSPVDVWDVNLAQGRRATFSFRQGNTVAFVVLRGNVQINGDIVREGQFALMDREAGDVLVEAGGTDASVLVLSGEPLNEPIAGYGPFVMNTNAEIHQAVRDFNSGQFGRIPPRERA
jgi:quercetin 2,3-dioxygenase